MQNKKTTTTIAIISFSSMIFSLFAMLGVSVWGSKVSNESFRQEIASQEGHLLSTPDIDSFTLCGSLMPFTAETPERSSLNRALMVPFPWSAKTDPCPELQSWISGNEWPTEFVQGTYARYWWGIGSLIRILTNWLGLAGTLKVLSSLFLVSLMAYAGTVSRKIGVIAPLFVVTPIFLFTTFNLREPAPHISVTFSLGLLTAASSMLTKRREYALLAIFIGGMWISFFDLLTYPVVYALIASSGIILEDVKAKIGWLCQFTRATLALFLWFLGYATAMFGKQIFLWVFGDSGSSSQILAETLWRMDGPIDSDHPTTPSFAIKMVVGELINEPLFGILLTWSLLLLLAVFAITLISILLKARTKLSPILLCMVLPIAWFVFVKNHTIIHPWLAYYAILAGLGLASAITYLATKELVKVAYSKRINV